MSTKISANVYFGLQSQKEICYTLYKMAQETNISRQAYWLALAFIDGIGTKRLKRLIERFVPLEKVFESSISEIACLPGFNPLSASKILCAGKNLNNFQRQVNWLKSKGIEILCLEDRQYPQSLKEIPNAPLILCKKGILKEISKNAVAIVGTRVPTMNGFWVARKLAAILASEGFTIVSGLARGIDTAAHLGAMDANGATVAVLGCNLWKIYPKENSHLANSICDNSGNLISEHPFDTQPTPANLVLRNRIISGLSLGTIVIEADENNGAMHTAKFARNQGRNVYAYCWQTKRQLTGGPDKLIENGAIGINISNVSTLIDDLLKVKFGEFSVEEKNKQLELF